MAHVYTPQETTTQSGFHWTRRSQKGRELITGWISASTMANSTSNTTYDQNLLRTICTDTLARSFRKLARDSASGLGGTW